jgi:hypothetical protein
MIPYYNTQKSALTVVSIFAGLFIILVVYISFRKSIDPIFAKFFKRQTAKIETAAN